MSNAFADVDRLFWPTKGRLERKVGRHAKKGQELAAVCPAAWWGPFCVFLVYRKVDY
jgi:hypothetical protein